MPASADCDLEFRLETQIGAMWRLPSAKARQHSARYNGSDMWTFPQKKDGADGVRAVCLPPDKEVRRITLVPGPPIQKSESDASPRYHAFGSDS